MSDFDAVMIKKTELERLRAEIERLRALLAQYQVANYAPEDSDLYEETRRALEGK